MAVQTFNPTDLSQSATNWAVAQRIVGIFAPHEAAMPNLTVALDPGHLMNGTVLVEVPAQLVGPFTPPTSGFRIDRVVIDRTTGAASIVTGAANSLTPPTIPAGKLPVARVMLQPTTDTIGNDLIVDERASLDQTTRSVVAVQAHRNGVGQSGVPNNAWTKVELTTAQVNTGGAFDISTSRFQPNVAGLYLLHGQVLMLCGANGSLYSGIFVNGAVFVQGRSLVPIVTQAYSSVTGIYYLNGTTDYVELYVLNTSVTTGIVDGTPACTFLTASLLS